MAESSRSPSRTRSPAPGNSAAETFHIKQHSLKAYFSEPYATSIPNRLSVLDLSGHNGCATPLSYDRHGATGQSLLWKHLTCNLRVHCPSATLTDIGSKTNVRPRHNRCHPAIPHLTGAPLCLTSVQCNLLASPFCEKGPVFYSVLVSMETIRCTGSLGWSANSLMVPAR